MVIGEHSYIFVVESIKSNMNKIFLTFVFLINIALNLILSLLRNVISGLLL